MIFKYTDLSVIGKLDVRRGVFKDRLQIVYTFERYMIMFAQRPTNRNDYWF